MSRFKEYYPQEDSPEFFGDRGFLGWDARTSPEKLPEGMLSVAVNVWLEGRDARTRPGVAFASWSLVPRWDTAPTQSPSLVYPAWLSGLIYYEGARVVVGSNTWECAVAEDEPASESALTTDGNWTNLGGGYWPLQDYVPPLDGAGEAVRLLRHACAYAAAGSGVPWVARAYDGMVWLSRPGSEAVRVDYPAGELAPEGSRLVSAWGKLFLFRGLDQKPLVWAGEAGAAFAFLEAAFPGESEGEDRITAPLPGGQVALEHRGRLLVGRGEELYVSDLLEAVHSPAAGVELMPGGAGDIVALASYGPEVLVFRAVGIFRVRGLDSVDAWEILPVTYAKGAVGPDAVAVAGREVWFMADDGIYNLNQVGDTGDNRMGVGDTAGSLQVSTVLRQLLAAKWRDQVRAVVSGPRVLWAVPVGESPEGRVLHRVLVWRQDSRMWEALWVQSLAAENALFQPDEGDELDWHLAAWVQALVGGVETLMHAADEGLYEWMTGERDDCRPYDLEDGLNGQWVRSRVRTRGLGWANEGTRRSQRVRIEGSTWAPSFEFSILGANGEVWPDPLGMRTHSNRKSLKVGVPRWTPTNVNGDHARDGREDYALDLPASTPELHTVAAVDALRLTTYAWEVRGGGDGRFFQLEVWNEAGVFNLSSVGYELAKKRFSSFTRGS